VHLKADRRHDAAGRSQPAMVVGSDNLVKTSFQRRLRKKIQLQSSLIISRYKRYFVLIEKMLQRKS
jgi:hypothetical protein